MASPFAATKANRIRAAARDLIKQGFLLREDAAVIIQEAASSRLFGTAPAEAAPR